MSMHLFEGLDPGGPGFSSRPDEQLPLLHDEINRSVELALFYD